MCLIAFAWRIHPDYPLVVAANRDEFYGRPTDAAHWWPAPYSMFGGRDRRAGGAWCALDRRGRFAAVTNVRDHTAGERSRGLLVRDYFRGDDNAATWAATCAADGAAFGPFNLLVADRDTLWFVSNRGATRELRLEPGVYAISNGHWHDRWPKTERAGERLRSRLDQDTFTAASGFALLADTDFAPRAALPDTGVGAARERSLSPIFIRGEQYGTRASTVITRSAQGRVDFHEHGFDADARLVHRVHERWSIDSRAADE